MNTADLFVLFRETGQGAQFEMGGERSYNARRRTFTGRGHALSYARKHDAKVAHIQFPPDGLPIVVEVIDPKETAR